MKSFPGAEPQAPERTPLPDTAGKASIWLLVAGIGLVAVIGGLDYLTGPDLGFFIFYFLPIALVAWYVGRGPAMLVACLCTAAWFLVEELSGPRVSWWGARAWNAGIRGVTFVLMAGLVARMRGAVETERRLNAALARQLQQVQGLLPICAACKRIRNDQGYWEQVEAYFREHAGVEFTHGICPACRQKLYPELYDRS